MNSEVSLPVRMLKPLTKLRSVARRSVGERDRSGLNRSMILYNSRNDGVVFRYHISEGEEISEIVEEAQNAATSIVLRS